MADTTTTLNPDPLFTPAQAAEYLTTTVYQLAADRRTHRAIPYVKVGRLVRYQRSQLDAYIASQRVGGIAA